MTDVSSRQILRDRLASELGPTVAESLVTRLVHETGKPDVCAQALTLLNELEEFSPKAACAAIEHFRNWTEGADCHLSYCGWTLALH